MDKGGPNRAKAAPISRNDNSSPPSVIGHVQPTLRSTSPHANYSFFRRGRRASTSRSSRTPGGTTTCSTRPSHRAVRTAGTSVSPTRRSSRRRSTRCSRTPAVRRLPPRPTPRSWRASGLSRSTCSGRTRWGRRRSCLTGTSSTCRVYWRRTGEGNGSRLRSL